MRDDGFEWDDAKAVANLALHGVDFNLARRVFDDVFALGWLDVRHDYGEDRYIVIGMAADRLLFVAYTMREGRIRMISARAAEPHERRAYHEDQDQGR